MGAHGQEDWFDEVMPGLDAVRPGGKRRFPWPGRHGKDDGDEAEARTRPRIGVRVGVATVIVTGLMVTAGLTAGMVSANRLERAVADARGLLAGSTADQYKVPYLYRRLEQLTEQAAGLLDDGSASPEDMDRLSQGIDSMVASLASGTR